MSDPVTSDFVRSPRGTPGPRDWILDIFGSFVRDVGGWITVADLLQLLDDLGISASSGRSSLSRMKQRGELDAVTRGVARGYRLTERADQWFANGTPRIVELPSGNDDEWALASFTLPEEGRRIRYHIRSRLRDLGFGKLSGGLMIAPAHVLDETTRALQRANLISYVDLWRTRHVGDRPLDEIVSLAWDLEAIRSAYDDYLTLAHDLRSRTQPTDDAEAFSRALVNINSWRDLPFLDPALPLRHLPPDWPSTEARQAFNQIAAQLRPGAWRHFARVVTRSTP